MDTVDRRLQRYLSNLLLLVSSALLYTLAQPPFEWSGLAWIALAPLFIALRGKSGRLAFLEAAFFGVLICAGVAWWLCRAIDAYFGASWILDVSLTIGAYIVFVGVYTGVGGWIIAVLLDKGSPMIRLTAIPAAWVAAEYARSSTGCGFAWQLLGYSQYRHLALIQIADVTGVYGISYLNAMGGYVASELLLAALSRLRGGGVRIAWVPPISFAAIVLVVLAYGEITLTSINSSAPARTRVAIVNHDVPQNQRWHRVHYTNAVLHYVDQTRDAVAKGSAALVIWPEFAAGFYIDREPALRAQLAWLARDIDAPLLLGAPRLEEDGSVTRFYNSVYLLDARGDVVESYDKMRLLPMAEYRPLAWLALGHRDSDYPQHFSPGTRATLFPMDKGPFGVMICYESTFPSMARHLVRSGAKFLVNISNDVWLSNSGTSAAATQHFSMAAMRAVENKRAMVSVTSWGISGFVDPYGSVHKTASTPDSSLIDDIALNDRITIYTQLGDWFAAVCAVYSMAAAVVLWL